ncbi:MAG: Ig-like domain-containing protein, partial [Gemmatimonadota bacterium]
MRRRSRLTAILVMLPLGACGDDEPAGPEPPDGPGPPASLSLSADEVRLAAIGAAYPLVATVSDSNGVALGDATVEWSSADDDVATVDGSGRVEAVGEGETEVTATAGDDGAASDAATVIVTQDAASIAVSPTLAKLHALGDSAHYSATVRDANGAVIEGAAVEWTSDA